MKKPSSETEESRKQQKQILLLFGGGILFLVAVWIAVFTWGVPLVRYLHR